MRLMCNSSSAFIHDFTINHLTKSDRNPIYIESAVDVERRNVSFPFCRSSFELELWLIINRGETTSLAKEN